MIPADTFAGLGPAAVVRGNALDLPLADNTVDLCVTSPPYFALRSYQDNGQHYAGQIGSEATPDAFVSTLLDATREMMRVVKPSGSIWVNLGDKYATSSPVGSGGKGATSIVHGKGSNLRANTQSDGRRVRNGVREKSLIGVPWRYALRCIDELGLILRAEVIWSKPNGLPESVTDRVRRSHETWFHFTLSPRYFSAVDEIREAYDPDSLRASKLGATAGKARNASIRGGAAEYAGPNPLGKLPGSVWEIATEPLNVPPELGVDHFAAFPSEWPRRIISGWCPAGVCVACGEGRRPVAQAQEPPADLAWRARQGRERDGSNELGPSSLGVPAQDRGRVITDYACACPDSTAPTTPGVCLDPFGGTGTVAMVARALGRVGVSVDLSHDYGRLARWRVAESGGEYKVRGLEKPKAPQLPAQASIFDALDEGGVAFEDRDCPKCENTRRAVADPSKPCHACQEVAS